MSLEEKKRVSIDQANEAGFALIWAMALLIFTSILSVAMYHFVMSNTKQVINQSVQMSSYYVAESGIELASAFLANKIPDNKSSLQLNYHYNIGGHVYNRNDLLTKLGEKENKNITMMDVISSSNNTLYLGDDPDTLADNLKLFIPNKKDAIGEIYVTIAKEAGFGTDWLVVKSTGTYYKSGTAGGEREITTAVMRIDVNNHGHIEREYFDGKQ